MSAFHSGLETNILIFPIAGHMATVLCQEGREFRACPKQWEIYKKPTAGCDKSHWIPILAEGPLLTKSSVVVNASMSSTIYSNGSRDIQKRCYRKRKNIRLM